MPEDNDDFVIMKYTQSTIENFLKRINFKKKNGIFLPYIQRDFVWKQERIYSLLDSIMRGYPIGNILIWETEADINYREFTKDYNHGQVVYKIYIDNKKLQRQYILDGLQRIQSLYIAMFGLYDGETLFFNAKGENDNIEYKYIFKFYSNTPDKQKGLAAEGWLNVPDFLSCNYSSITDIADKLRENKIISTICTKEEEETICKNAKRLYDVFKNEYNIILQKITNNTFLPDITKIFIRVNSGGVTLKMEDLTMAIISAELLKTQFDFNKLVEEVIGIGIKNPKSFIIKTYSTILSDVYKDKIPLIDAQGVLKEKFYEISVAIFDVVNFIIDNLIAPLTFIIPFDTPVIILIAYHYALQKDNRLQEWNNRKGDIIGYLFTAFLTDDLKKPTKTVIKKLLSYVIDKNNTFSLNGIRNVLEKNFTINVEEILDKTRISEPTANLIMYLFYYSHRDYRNYINNIPKGTIDRDHIFPESRLTGDYPPRLWDSIKNCELLPATENGRSRKTNLLLNAFFQRFYSGEENRKAFIKLHAIPDNADLWGDLGKFKEFMAARKPIMAKRIKDSLSNLNIQFITSLDNNMSSSTSLTIDDD